MIQDAGVSESAPRRRTLDAVAAIVACGEGFVVKNVKSGV